MSTQHENIKHIPVIKAKATMPEFNRVMRVVALVAKQNKCKQFFNIVKVAELPTIEEANASTAAHTVAEIAAAGKHGLAIHIITIAFQAHVKLSSFITETETVLWPTGEIQEVMTKIEKYFKLTSTSSNMLKHTIKKIAFNKSSKQYWKNQTGDKACTIRIQSNHQDGTNKVEDQK